MTDNRKEQKKFELREGNTYFMGDQEYRVVGGQLVLQAPQPEAIVVEVPQPPVVVQPEVVHANGAQAPIAVVKKPFNPPTAGSQLLHKADEVPAGFDLQEPKKGNKMSTPAVTAKPAKSIGKPNIGFLFFMGILRGLKWVFITLFWVSLGILLILLALWGILALAHLFGMLPGIQFSWNLPDLSHYLKSFQK